MIVFQYRSDSHLQCQYLHFTEQMSWKPAPSYKYLKIEFSNMQEKEQDLIGIQ